MRLQNTPPRSTLSPIRLWLAMVVGWSGLLIPNETLGQTVRWVAPIGWTGSTGNGSSSNAPLVFSFATVNGWLLNSSMGDLTVMFLPGTYLISDTVNPGSAHHRFVIGGDGNRVVRLVGVADSVQPIEQSTKSYAVNFVGVALGSFVHASSAMARAAYWPSRSSGSNSPAVDLLTWMAPAGTSGTDTSSEAFGINSQSVVAGMSGNGGSFARAVLKRSLASPWIDLNDRHFVAGHSGWSLQTALRVNDQLLVAGNGIKNGSPRAFVLVPRNYGN